MKERSNLDDESLNAIMRVLRSRKRRQVLELVLHNVQGLRFSEIARALEIYPSTLEKHLASLVKSGAIAHHNQLYLPTLNSGLIWQALDGFLSISPEPYLMTHTLPLEDDMLRREFRSLTFEVILDLISIINKIRDDFEKPQTMIQAGGQLDYHIGRSVYGSGMLSHKKTKVEIILNEQLINDIRCRGEESLFLSQFDESMTQLYSIKECSLGLGVSDSSGFLFLPRLDHVVDFNQCMYTQSREGVSWLKKVFGCFKKQAQIFIP
jgi:predicted transcriptional regulator